MRIDILYFDGCPNHAPAVAMVSAIVRDLGIDVEVKEIELKEPEDAKRMRFLGSPSIRVDGIDIEPEARDRMDFGFACRPYGGAGLPPKEMLVAALHGVSSSQAIHIPQASVLSNGGRTGSFAAGGSFAAAVIASACCWLPLLAVAFGVSAGGLGAIFEKTRPVFLTLAAVLLGVGFYYTYFRKDECAPGSACETPNAKLKRSNGIMLWMATAGVALFAFFPSYSGLFTLAPSTVAPDAHAMDMKKIEIEIGGMTCAGCAVTLQQELAKVPGVSDAVVLLDQKRAVVRVASESPPTDTVLVAAVKRAGFEGTIFAAE